MQTRVDGIRAAIETLDRGGPPLLSSRPPWGTPGVTTATYEPVGVGDDQGAYLYLSYLGHWTDESDPVVLFRWSFIGLMALLLLAYPLLFYELFGSVAAGLIAPVLVLWKFEFLANTDIYWVTAWGTLLGLPAVAVAYKLWDRNRRAAVALLITTMVLASFVTSIRIHSGLPILLSGLGVAAMKGGRRWSAVLFATALVLSYLSISTGGLAAVRAYRNHVVAAPGFGVNQSTQHPFWHNAYIGLGYLPNRYGIAWDDSIALEAVNRSHPDVQFLSPQYERTLRHLYFKIAREDPGLLLRNYELKLRAISVDVTRRFWALFLILPAAMIAGRQRRDARLVVLVAVPALILGAIPPMLTLPATVYSMGWLGAWAFLWLCAFSLLASSAVSAVPKLVAIPKLVAEARNAGAAKHHVPLLTPQWRARWLKPSVGVALGLGLILSFHALGTPVPPLNPVKRYRANQSEFAPVPVPESGKQIVAWDFVPGLPRGWSSIAGPVLTPSRKGLAVTTTKATFGRQLWTRPERLGAGVYSYLVAGTVIDGGVRLRVLDTSSRNWIGRAQYWSGQEFGHGLLGATFRLTKPTRVRFVLSSWAPVDHTSRWLISRASVRKKDGAGA